MAEKKIKYNDVGFKDSVVVNTKKGKVTKKYTKR